MTDALRDVIDKLLMCWCDAAYKDRGLVQPDCPQHNFAGDVEDAVLDWIKRVRPPRAVLGEMSDYATLGEWSRASCRVSDYNAALADWSRNLGIAHVTGEGRASA